MSLMEIKDGLSIDRYGTKRWYKGGVIHREDGPAMQYKDSTRWVINGTTHRIGGPAVEYSNIGEKYWYLYGYEYTKEEYNHLVSNLPLLYWNRFKKDKWL